MQNNSQKRGVALGAIAALIGSFFLGAMPAQATTPTDGAHIAVTPLEGPVANFNGTILEDFPVHAYLLPGISNSNFAAEKVRVAVTRVSGAVDIYVGSTSETSIPAAAVRASVSEATGGSWDGNTGTSVSSFAAVIRSDWTTASVFTPLALDSSAARIVIRAISESATLASLSGLTAVVDVKVWVENSATNNGLHDSLEWYTTKRITLHAVSAVPVSAASIGALSPGDMWMTASATVGALNFENLSGDFKLLMRSADDEVFVGTQGTNIDATYSAVVTADQATSRSGVISQSFAVSRSAGIAVGDSISGRVVYVADSADYLMGSTFSSVAVNPGVDELYLQVVADDNLTLSSGVATARTNTEFTIRVGAKTGSASVSKAISVTFADTDANLSVAVKEINFNGGAATTSFATSASPLSVTTGTNGFANFTIKTNGFVGDETFVMTAYVGNVSKSLTIEVDAATHSLTPVYTTYQSGAGDTTAVSWQVKDQWLVATPRTDFRVKTTKGGTGFNYSETISYVSVVAGTATLNFTPQPAAKTGSALVDATLQVLNSNTGGYIETGKTAARVTVNVSPTSNAFGTGLAASRSVSVSYFPDTVSWVTVTGKVTNTGSAVAVSGAGLVFKDASGATYSDAVTVRAGSGPSYTFDVAGTTAGTYTMTLTNGSATTTSLVIVDAAAHDSGAAIAFDTTEIVAGRTKIVVGTVTDANGNPVDTTAGAGTASIVVTYAGTAGIPVGTMPTETDADGKFRVSILTSAADSGTFTLTAVYLKDGASTATADKITKVQTVTVGATSAAADADKKVNAGSFKGYVAIYAKGYEGQRLSAKVGKDWVVVASLASNFERVVEFTGAGYTIAVRIYIDRVLVDTITVTTK